MNSLLFLTNRLQNPQVYRQINLPLEFISFGIAEGKMYTHFRKRGAFVVQHDDKIAIRWGNSVVYGGLFYCPDIWYYLRILDGYHICSKSSLGSNHVNDLHHRITVDVTPIRFDTLDELVHLKYREGEPVKAYFYVGNLHHPKILSRVVCNKPSRRVADGIEAEHFKTLFREVTG